MYFPIHFTAIPCVVTMHVTVSKRPVNYALHLWGTTIDSYMVFGWDCAAQGYPAGLTSNCIAIGY